MTFSFGILFPRVCTLSNLATIFLQRKILNLVRMLVTRAFMIVFGKQSGWPKFQIRFRIFNGVLAEMQSLQRQIWFNRVFSPKIIVSCVVLPQNQRFMLYGSVMDLQTFGRLIYIGFSEEAEFFQAFSNWCNSC